MAWRIERRAHTELVDLGDALLIRSRSYAASFVRHLFGDPCETPSSTLKSNGPVTHRHGAVPAQRAGKAARAVAEPVGVRPGQVITKAGMLEQCHCEPAAPRPDSSLGKPRQLEEPDVPRLQSCRLVSIAPTTTRGCGEETTVRVCRRSGPVAATVHTTPPPRSAYQADPVDPRGIDKGHDVLDELVEPVGPPGPRPGMPGVTTLVRCDDPSTGRE